MTSPGERLPFGFARRFGVLLDTSTQPASLLIRSDTPLTVLAEVQRRAGVEVHVQRVPDAHFNERLTHKIGRAHV